MMSPYHVASAGFVRCFRWGVCCCFLYLFCLQDVLNREYANTEMLSTMYTRKYWSIVSQELKSAELRHERAVRYHETSRQDYDAAMRMRMLPKKRKCENEVETASLGLTG